MAEFKTIDIPVRGMDCAECTQHVRHAIAALPGVRTVEVYLAAERASVQLDPSQVDLAAIRDAVAAAGYRVPEEQPTGTPAAEVQGFARRIGALLGILFGVILFVIVLGEWLGLFERLTERVPWFVGATLVLAAGFSVFRNVIRATLRRQIISHTLMTLGVIAALAVGQWTTALVVVFFMRIGDYVEKFTADRARQAVKNLAALMPQTARVERDGQEIVMAADTVLPGEIVVVRPGEQIPVDGEVLSGSATVNQATITGEPLPIEAGPGSHVYAATFAQFGALRVRATRVGGDATLGRVVRLVEEAETRRGPVQTIADRFSGYYLPVVAGIALLTFLVRRDPLATAAVLVVACSCSFALATPIAMLASIAAAARRGLLIKGGRYLETLARADVLLLDKTGTVTLGQPVIHEIRLLKTGFDETGALHLAASAERYSEHPLAEAVRQAASSRGIALAAPQDFRATPGQGIHARVEGQAVSIGNLQFMTDNAISFVPYLTEAEPSTGHTRLFLAVDREPAAILVAADTLRTEVPAALQEVRRLGIRQVELLTGDNQQAAAALAHELGIAFRAGLLPEDKIRIVREYQAAGHTVVMVGDGVNDAPALAQADIGVAMGAAGSDIAIEAAHIALLRDDWSLVPQLLQIAQRTMGVVKANLGFTALYNLLGLTLAALGILPPVLAAAAQSLPDLGILGNSARLLRQK